MENIKMETELRLESIFLSIDYDSLYKLNDISSVYEIDLQDKASINKFIYLAKQTERIPNIDLLKKEFPDLYFDNVEILKNDELDDYIRLYIANIKNKAISRKLSDLALKVRTNGIDEETITKLNMITKSETVNIPYTDIGDNILDIYKKKVDTNGIKTGVKAVDNDTGGLHPGTLTTILGFTGSFKTTWAINIGYNAMVDNFNTLYLSLEVTKENIYYNLLSRQSFDSKYTKHIEHLAFKQRKLTDDEFNYIESKIYPDLKELPGKQFIIDETELENYSFFSLESKFREIEKLAIEQTGHGIDLLIIDHAQLLKFDSTMKSVGNETNVVNAYVSFFRQCCLNWCHSGRQIAGLILSQSSREGWKEAVKNEGQYRLTALAEANELERASSLVLSVYSSSSLKQIKAAKVQILKNRDGQVWSEPQEVFVDPAYYAFGDVQNSLDTNSNFNTVNINSLFDVNDNSINDINLMDLDLGV